MAVGRAVRVGAAEGVLLGVGVGLGTIVDVLVAVEVAVLLAVAVLVEVGVGPIGGKKVVGVMVGAVGTGVRVGATQSPTLLQEPPTTKLPEMLRQ